MNFLHLMNLKQPSFGATFTVKQINSLVQEAQVSILHGFVGHKMSEPNVKLSRYSTQVMSEY